MNTFTNDELNLMCIYKTGSRTNLIVTLKEMQEYLEPQEKELRELTDSTLAKLGLIDDKEFEGLELLPDF